MTDRQRFTVFALLAILTAALSAIALYAQFIDTDPKIIVPAKVVSVQDGDTLTMDVTMRLNVRLLDCWSPELSESGGHEAKRKLSELLVGNRVILTVPIRSNVAQSVSLGRVLGRVSVDGKDVSNEMVKAKAATKTKPMGK